MPTLRTHDLTKSYGGRTVVRGVNLEVASGEIVGLLGPNGAGKTTTFYMVVGLTAPDAGRVVLDGHDVTDDPMYVRARKGIGYLPQEASIFRGLSVEQNIIAILETLNLDGATRRAAATTPATALRSAIPGRPRRLPFPALCAQIRAALSPASRRPTESVDTAEAVERLTQVGREETCNKNLSSPAVTSWVTRSPT